MDKIIISGLKVFAYHGVNEAETRYGQNFVLDIEVQTDLTQAGKTDSLEDTVSYAQMIKTVRRTMTAENNQLLERAAQRVADALLDEYSRLDSVKIRLMKPEAPMKADFAYTAVEMERKRENK